MTLKNQNLIMENTRHFTQQVALPTKDGLVFLLLSNIKYLESESSYTKVITSTADAYLVNKQLKSFESFLPATMFFRAHKRYIVNKAYVSSFVKKDMQFILDSGERIPVSVRKKKTLTIEFNIMQ